MCDGEEGGCYITKLFTATSCSCVNNAQKWRDRERERERERERLRFSKCEGGREPVPLGGDSCFPAIQQKMINILAGERMNNTHIV